MYATLCALHAFDIDLTCPRQLKNSGMATTKYEANQGQIPSHTGVFKILGAQIFKSKMLYNS
jgi:hypothetical protein